MVQTIWNSITYITEINRKIQKESFLSLFSGEQTLTRNPVRQTITHIWDIKGHCLRSSEFFLLGACILEVHVAAEVVNYFPLALYFWWWSHVENTNQNVLAGLTLSVPEHRESWMVKKKVLSEKRTDMRFQTGSWLHNATGQRCRSLWRSPSKKKKKTNRSPPPVSITWCQMVIRAVVVESSTDKTTLCSTRGRQRELFRGLK